MKEAWYYRSKVMLKRPYFKDEWCEYVISNPVRVVVQDDGRIQYWAFIAEPGKYLRVITPEDGETVFNAFPGSGFRR